MKSIDENGLVAMAILVMVAFNTLFLAANGLFMLVAPMPWYGFVPGVTDTGFFNQHFIRDIGLAYAASGLILLYAAANPILRWRAAVVAARRAPILRAR